MPYDPTALAASMVAFYWGNGDLVDLRNGYNLTGHTGGPSYNTGLVYPLAMEFGGPFVQDWADIASNADLSGDNEHFTVVQWVYNYVVELQNHGYSGKGTASGFEWMNEANTIGNPIYFNYRAATGDAEAGNAQASVNPFGPAPALNTWYLNIGYHDPDANVIGAMSSITSFARTEVAFGTGGLWVSGGPFSIGRSGPYFSSYMQGRTCPLMLFKGRKVTDDDIAFMYNSGAGQPYTAFFPTPPSGVGSDSDASLYLSKYKLPNKYR